jgi:hypothetical protein
MPQPAARMLAKISNASCNRANPKHRYDSIKWIFGFFKTDSSASHYPKATSLVGIPGIPP